MGWDVLKNPVITIVADNFTEEELVGINTFYKSKVGRSHAERNWLNCLNRRWGMI